VDSCDFILYSIRFEVVNYLIINIFFSTVKLYSFEVFASLSLNKGLVIFDVSKNILFLYEVDLSTSCCTICKADIVAFFFNSSSLS